MDNLLQKKTRLGGIEYSISDILANSSAYTLEQREGGVLATFPEVEILFTEDTVEQAKRQDNARSIFRTVTSLDQLLIDTSQVSIQKENKQMNENPTTVADVVYSGGRIPNRQITNDRAWAGLGRHAEAVRTAGSVTEEQLLAWHSQMPAGEEKTTFEDFLRRYQISVEVQDSPILQENSVDVNVNNQEETGQTASTPQGGSPMIDQPTPPNMDPSAVFNQQKESKPKTPRAPKDPTKALANQENFARDQALAEKAMGTLKQDDVKVVRELGAALCVFNGKIGVYAPITASDTRIKAEYIPSCKPQDRQLHPDFANQADPDLKGSKIPIGMSNTTFTIEMRESSPGSVCGFSVYVPQGVTNHMISNLHNSIAREELSFVLEKADRNPKSYVLVYISRARLSTLLSFLGVEAIEVSPDTRAPLARAITWEVVQRRKSNVSDTNAVPSLSHILRAKRDGASIPVCGGRFVPLKTWETGPHAQSDKLALTSFIFSSLYKTLPKTNIIRYERLDATSKSYFSGNVPSLIYSNYADKMSVPSFMKDGSLASLSWPLIRPGDGEKTARKSPEKIPHTDPRYNPRFKAGLGFVKDLFSDAKQARSTSAGAPKISKERGKAESIVALLNGMDVNTPSFDMNSFI